MSGAARLTYAEARILQTYAEARILHSRNVPGSAMPSMLNGIARVEFHPVRSSTTFFKEDESEAVVFERDRDADAGHRVPRRSSPDQARRKTNAESDRRCDGFDGRRHAGARRAGRR